MSARQRLHMHLAQALSRTDEPDVQAHLRAALEECQRLPFTPLAECPVCGRLGLPERIKDHKRVDE